MSLPVKVIISSVLNCFRAFGGKVLLEVGIKLKRKFKMNDVYMVIAYNVFQRDR